MKNKNQKRIVHGAWKWTHPTFVVEFNQRLSQLKKVVIDPSERMADIDRNNNELEIKW